MSQIPIQVSYWGDTYVYKIFSNARESESESSSTEKKKKKKQKAAVQL